MNPLISSCYLPCSALRYSPFGSVMPGREYANGAYRFGLNGMENAGDGTNNIYNFGSRIYLGRLGRWMSVDPFWQKYNSLSPYNFALNTPIIVYDNDGKDVFLVIFTLNKDQETTTVNAFVKTIQDNFNGFVQVSVSNVPEQVKTAAGMVVEMAYRVCVELNHQAINAEARKRLGPEAPESEVQKEAQKIIAGINSDANYQAIHQCASGQIKTIGDVNPRNVNLVIGVTDNSQGLMAAGHVPAYIDMGDVEALKKAFGDKFAFSAIIHEFAEEWGYIVGYNRTTAAKSKWNLKDPYPANHVDKGLAAQASALGCDVILTTRKNESATNNKNGLIEMVTYKKQSDGKYEKTTYSIEFKDNKLISETGKTTKSPPVTERQLKKDIKNYNKDVKQGRK